MKDKYHKYLLDTAKELDFITDSRGEIYQLASHISDDMENSSIIKLYKITQKFSSNHENDIILVAKKLYLALISLIGKNYIEELTCTTTPTQTPPRSLQELINELNQLIGLQKVKDKVTDLIALKKIQHLRQLNNLKTNTSTQHLAFIGNPGTGKTTVARIIGLIYKQLGILSKGHFTEVSRTDLIAGYQGQTAIKVKKVIEKAKGGVLFIDEAYSITENDQNDSYGKECLTELTKALEDYRDDLVVIVAGYTDAMEKFFNSNPGLKSRFNTFIEFDNYNKEELLLIFSRLCENNEYIITPDAYEKLTQIINESIINKDNNFSNGRFVRNLYEIFTLNQARRIAKTNPSPSREDLQLLKIEDITSN